jgi:hypothetical protein
MLTNLRLADLRLTTAQQRTTGQDLPSDLYCYANGLRSWRELEKSDFDLLALLPNNSTHLYLDRLLDCYVLCLKHFKVHRHDTIT